MKGGLRQGQLALEYRDGKYRAEGQRRSIVLEVRRSEKKWADSTAFLII